MKTRNITHEEYKELKKSSTLVDTKNGYPAIILHPDKTITKLWSKKAKLFSSARFYPYAKRFISNAVQLKRRGIPVPAILEHLRIKDSHVQLVRYEELSGSSIRNLLENSPNEVDMLGLANFIFGLHQKGIFFRAIHLGNVIQMPDGNFGLIDFTDVTFHSKPLSHQQRASNIATPLRYAADVKLIKQSNLPNLETLYLKLYKPSDADLLSFKKVVRQRTKNR